MINISNYYANDLDSFRYISHHGILGQKWGVRRYQNPDGTLTNAGEKRYHQRLEANQKYETKANKYHIKSDKAHLKSERAHNVNDLKRINWKKSYAARASLKADKNRKRALESDSVEKSLKYEKNAAKYDYRAAQYNKAANRIAKTTGYGPRAMRLSVKSDRFAIKAAKYEYKIKKNDLYLHALTMPISQIDSKTKKK